MRPITLAIRHGWQVRELLYDGQARLSRWATEILDRVRSARFAVAPPLLAELGEKAELELLAVVAMPDDLARARSTRLFDRPTSPGNLGTLIRSADAFGAGGVMVTGHAADAHGQRTIRASTGSLGRPRILMLIRDPNRDRRNAADNDQFSRAIQSPQQALAGRGLGRASRRSPRSCPCPA